MAGSGGPSLFSQLGRWFTKEPAVAVGAFGKCSTANGHQDVAGDSTRGMLETARQLYYDGALPNCRAWETELRDADRVLARTVVRWTAGRAYFCRLSSVAEGGSDTKAFAPQVSCVEVEASLALAVLPLALAALREVETPLATEGPARWPAILQPVRERICAEAERLRGEAASSQGSLALEGVRRVLGRLGPDSGRWIASLAEELGLPLRSQPDPSRRETVAGSRAASAPRLDEVNSGSLVDGDVAAWCGFLVAAGLGSRDFWILAADDMKSLRLVAGVARDRHFHALWRSREAAMEVPSALGERMLVSHLPQVEAWLSSLGIAPASPVATGSRLDFHPPVAGPSEGPAERLEGPSNEPSQAASP